MQFAHTFHRYSPARPMIRRGNMADTLPPIYPSTNQRNLRLSKAWPKRHKRKSP